MRHAYGYDQIFFQGSIVGDGTGQTIAIVNAFHTPTALADLNAFSTEFGLPPPPSFTQVSQTGGDPSAIPTNGTWALETALDIQWAHAFAPGASILLVEATTRHVRQPDRGGQLCAIGGRRFGRLDELGWPRVCRAGNGVRHQSSRRRQITPASSSPRPPATRAARACIPAIRPTR